MIKQKKRKKTGDEPYLVYDDGFLTDMKTDEEGFELP